MDVYFEKIAGVAEPLELQQERSATLPQEQPAAPLPGTERALDANGFPLSPLGDQDELWFVQAGRMHRPLARAAGVARSSGALMILSAVFSVLAGALALAAGNTSDGAITLGMALLLFILGLTERGGGHALVALDLAAPRRLALNQVVLLLVVAGLCLAGIRDADVAGAAGIDTAGMPPEMAEQLTAQLQGLAPLLVYGVYGVMFVVSLFVQGGMALYYLSRKKIVLAFHEELPPWVAGVVGTLQRR